MGFDSSARDQVMKVAVAARDEYAEEERVRAQVDYDDLLAKLYPLLESPIEGFFLAAFLPYVLRTDGEYTITPQAEVADGYRADFVIEFAPDAPPFVRLVVVECDGHDYHERTKEQAKRDKARERAITASGLPVFRFTGSELYRDAESCVEEIIDHTQGVLLDAINAQVQAARDGGS